MGYIEDYYAKFNEDKRLLSRHGQVEFYVTTHYLKKYIDFNNSKTLIDVGAGTGRYSFFLSDLGIDVSAVELCKTNLGVLKSKKKNVKAYQGNALDLKKFKDESFDYVLLLGPLYHLFSEEEKIKCLKEARRIVKPNGYIFVAYLLNEYSIIHYAFKENKIRELIELKKIDEDFQTHSEPSDLYSYVRLETIEKLNKESNLKRVELIAVDGPTDYIRQTINKMDEETFEIYLKYVLSLSKRSDLIGASSHVLDILRKEEY